MTGIGRMLIEAREARRVTLEQAERDTRIVRRYLEALEREDFAVFPFEVYARGFLRSYASYLGLDGAALVALMPGSSDAPDPRTAVRRPPSGHDLRRPTGPRPPERRRPEPPPEGKPGPDVRDRGRRAPAGPAPQPAPPADPAPDGSPVRARPAAGQAPPAGSPLRLAAVAGAILSTALLIGVVASRCSDSSIGGQPGFPGAGTVASTRTAPASGPAAVAGRMPDLSGLDETTALSQLAALGVTPFVIELPSREVAAGQVIRQSPSPGAAIGESTVMVVISRGG